LLAKGDEKKREREGRKKGEGIGATWSKERHAVR